MNSISAAINLPPHNNISGSINSKSSLKELHDARSHGAKTDSHNIAELSEDEKAVVEHLKKTDREVRAHEQAHKNAGGRYAGSASFGYTKGPDGKRYVISGEVPIDIAPVEGDPKATIAKMDAVIAAALAPAKPSSQDRTVAARASALRAEASSELAQSHTSDEENGEKQFTEGQSVNHLPEITTYQKISSFAGPENRSSVGSIFNFIS